MRKLRHRDATKPAQGHTARKWQVKVSTVQLSDANSPGLAHPWVSKSQA